MRNLEHSSVYRTLPEEIACDSIWYGSGSVKIIDARPATTLCGNPLNDATFDLGAGEISSYTNSSTGVRIDLLSRTASAD